MQIKKIIHTAFVVRCRVMTVFITNPSNGKRTKIYELHDRDLYATLMSSAVVNELELHGKYRMIKCHGINGTWRTRTQAVTVEIQGIGYGKPHLLHDVICLDQMLDIPESIPSKLDEKRYPHIRQISIPKIPRDSIYMVIGADN